ncbi:MAG: HAD-IA family hydrolase [Deltaproteobacteria bacterium]|nr:HAD-IA family hydrolase [Deltaproteobacteria bacterium]
MAALTIKQSIIKTIIFDFDGTLAKLNIDFRQMREDVLKLILSYGITRDQLHTYFVLEMIDGAFEILNQRSAQKSNKFLDEANSIIENIEIQAANNGELFDRTKELLKTLQSRNISCGIITRNCAKAVKIVFPDILSYCSVLVCRDDVNNVKPHPEHLNLALNKLGSSAESTLMIGDHPLDIQTGLNAGTKTCGVLTGRCQRNDFIEAGADIILSQAADILDIIK